MTMPAPTPWVPAHDTLILTEWAAGRSAAEIVKSFAAIGVIRTRSGIIGRLQRIGAPQRDPEVRYVNQVRASTLNAMSRPKAKSTVKPPKPPRQQRPGLVFGPVNILDKAATEKAINTAYKAGKSVETRVNEGCGVDSPHARPYMDAPSGSCRWPLSEKPNLLACCNPVASEGKPYCAGHSAAAYVGRKGLGTAGWVVGRVNKIERIDLNVKPRQPAPSDWDAARAAA
ncbi:hypothetical protein HNP32_003441 [Brevundimonas bullata]|uniref:GcrA cell cycle regulator n=1 Tax=Brevundimonas bullata TaxID=13160 RepID=A0A7W7N5S3_9CAUL|nr:GcrA family cell cycle regulator [Brevundimonas bullata]MBB4799681.1 hypothetical protein [Brevundimonas bullata]MBB6384697.1 hypothetical protein [Brevundimonas bullata]